MQNDMKIGGLNLATQLILGLDLCKLYVCCENQKSVSTKKLEKHLDEIEEALRKHGLQVKKLVNALPDEATR